MTSLNSAAAPVAVQPRVLVLVNKSYGPYDITQAVDGCRTQFVQDFGLMPQVQDSASWYREQFTRAGSWDAWIHSTVHGKQYGSRRSYFDVFVVCSSTLGKANAGIVRQALEVRKIVMEWRKDKPLQVVSELLCVNPNSWTDGWSVRTQAVSA